MLIFRYFVFHRRRAGRYLIENCFFLQALYSAVEIPPFSYRSFIKLRCILDLQKRVHGMHEICHIPRRPSREQVFLEEVRVNPISHFTYLMEAFLEGYRLLLPPVAKSVMRNPVSSECPLDQPVKLLAAILRPPGFDKVEDSQQGFEFANSHHQRGEIGSRLVASLGFLAVETGRIPQLVLADSLCLRFPPHPRLTRTSVSQESKQRRKLFGGPR